MADRLFDSFQKQNMAPLYGVIAILLLVLFSKGSWYLDHTLLNPDDLAYYFDVEKFNSHNLGRGRVIGYLVTALLLDLNIEPLTIGGLGFILFYAELLFASWIILLIVDPHDELTNLQKIIFCGLVLLYPQLTALTLYKGATVMAAFSFYFPIGFLGLYMVYNGDHWLRRILGVLLIFYALNYYQLILIPLASCVLVRFYLDYHSNLILLNKLKGVIYLGSATVLYGASIFVVKSLFTFGAPKAYSMSIAPFDILLNRVKDIVSIYHSIFLDSSYIYNNDLTEFIIVTLMIILGGLLILQIFQKRTRFSALSFLLLPTSLLALSLIFAIFPLKSFIADRVYAFNGITFGLFFLITIKLVKDNKILIFSLVLLSSILVLNYAAISSKITQRQVGLFHVDSVIAERIINDLVDENLIDKKLFIAGKLDSYYFDNHYLIDSKATGTTNRSFFSMNFTPQANKIRILQYYSPYKLRRASKKEIANLDLENIADLEIFPASGYIKKYDDIAVVFLSEKYSIRQ